MRQPGTARIAPQHRRADPAAGAEGNEKLTAMTGAILLVGFAIEGFTILEIHRLLYWHFLLGLVLIGPVLLKIASTLYRFARYYAGSAPYVRKGPPAPVLRVLGPLVVLTSVAVLGTGVILAVAWPRRTLAVPAQGIVRALVRRPDDSRAELRAAAAEDAGRAVGVRRPRRGSPWRPGALAAAAGVAGGRRRGGRGDDADVRLVGRQLLTSGAAALPPALASSMSRRPGAPQEPGGPHLPEVPPDAGVRGLRSPRRRARADPAARPAGSADGRAASASARPGRKPGLRRRRPGSGAPCPAWRTARRRSSSRSSPPGTSARRSACWSGPRR